MPDSAIDSQLFLFIFLSTFCQSFSVLVVQNGPLLRLRALDAILKRHTEKRTFNQVSRKTPIILQNPLVLILFI